MHFLTATKFPRLDDVLGWQRIANELAQWPQAVDEIIAQAKNTPDDHIAGYMNRFWLRPFGSLRAEGPLDVAAIRVHEILREDLDRHMHNHRWPFRTIILKGGYTEEVRFPPMTRTGGSTVVQRHLFQGQTTWHPLNSYHRITGLLDGEKVTTLCLFGKPTAEDRWGFLKDGEHIDSKIYLALPPEERLNV